MKSKVFLLIIVCILAVYSCKSVRQTAQGEAASVVTANDITIVDGRALLVSAADTVSAPTLANLALDAGDDSTPSITVRTESVTLADRGDIETMFAFYVIIGSFREIVNARQYSEELTSKGFSPVILVSELGLFRVSVGGYDQENLARQQITQIRANHEEHADVWLLVRK